MTGRGHGQAGHGASEKVLSDDAILLLRLGEEAGGRIDPARILARKPGSTSRQAFLELLDQRSVDGEGWITAHGSEQLAEQSSPEGGPSDVR